MGNSLNLKNSYGISKIAQGDNSSTLTYDLLDHNNLIIPSLDSSEVMVYLIKDSVIGYEYATQMFDSRVEFNIGTILEPGTYKVEMVMTVDDYDYVFPSDGSTKIKIFESVLG